MRAAAILLCAFLLTATASSQGLPDDLKALVTTPAVTGYEQALGKEIQARLAKYKPQTDNMGNVFVTLGSGAPHRLIVAPMDEPGYVVSSITEDGYLRVQRLPQAQPHPLFDQLHAAQPVMIRTRSGKDVYGVVAGLSTHLQGGRRDAPRVTHPDEMYIDIGASSAEEVRRAGVDVLDPLTLDRQIYAFGFRLLTGTSIGDRFGIAVLMDSIRWLDIPKLKGTLTVAFVAQQWANSRGLDRLMQHIKADEMIYVGRLLPQRPTPGQAASTPLRSPQKQPGGGVLIGTENPDAVPEGLAAELWKIAEENKIPIARDFSAPLPRVSYTQGPELPRRFAHLAVAAAWPVTPAEIVDVGDLYKLTDLLRSYVSQGELEALQERDVEEAEEATDAGRPRWGPQGPTTTQVLRRLVEAYGVSGFEGSVREEIKQLLPPWAKPETDAAGNLILRFGASGSKGPRLVFVAHMDEIGYVVRSIADDGRLVVESRGGGILEFFAGHLMLVRTTSGEVLPGVMELPAGWDQPGFEWPRGQRAVLRVDVGARSAAEAEKLGIKVGDWMTVPKKYRQLYGTRANGRSFDDRVGCTALVAAAWALGPAVSGREVIFIWATEEEVGLRGALAAAKDMAAKGQPPDYVFAVDTFVSSDSPLESPRYGDAKVGKGFAVRAVDNSNIVPRESVDRVVALAKTNKIAVQYGVTSGGNDGAVFLRYGARDIPIGWPLRYSHSPGEVIDTRDVEALATIVAVIARSW